MIFEGTQKMQRSEADYAAARAGPAAMNGAQQKLNELNFACRTWRDTRR